MKRNEFVRQRPPVTDNAGAIYGFAHKIIPLLLIAFGLSLSAAIFAGQYPEYVEGESPLFYLSGTAVYAPWDYIIWLARAWSATSLIDDFYIVFVDSSQPLIYTTVVACVLYILMSYARGLSHRFNKLYGTARWATERDLNKAGLFAASGVVLGQTKRAIVSASSKSGSSVLSLKKPAKIIAHTGDVHTLLVAPSRAGKGVSSIIPTLFSWRGSCIVFDPKGENYAITAGARSRHSHVLRFSPVDENSIHFNPLQEVRKGKNAFRDASNIAETLIAPAGGQRTTGTAEDHFNETAKGLLTGAVLHVLSCPFKKDKSLAGVLDFLSSSPLNEQGETDYGEGFLREMLTAPHDDPTIDGQVKNIASQNLSRPDRERGSVISTAVRSLWLFQDSLIRQNTSEHELCIEDFMTSEFPISLYLTVPYSDIDRLSPIIRLIVTFFVRRMTEGETSEKIKTQRKYKTLFLLDEFPVLGSFPFLETTAGILAGYGISLFLVCQSLAQLYKLYGEKTPFLEHCKTWVTYAPGDLTSAKAFAEIIGKETVWKEQISTSGSKFEVAMKNMNISGNEIERNLMNADELMKLSPESLIVFMHGLPPYLGKKNVYYEDVRFKDNVGLKFPMTREEIKNELPRNGECITVWGAEQEEPMLMDCNYDTYDSDDAAMMDGGGAIIPLPEVQRDEYKDARLTSAAKKYTGMF